MALLRCVRNYRRQHVLESQINHSTIKRLNHPPSAVRKLNSISVDSTQKKRIIYNIRDFRCDKRAPSFDTYIFFRIRIHRATGHRPQHIDSIKFNSQQNENCAVDATARSRTQNRRRSNNVFAVRESLLSFYRLNWPPTRCVMSVGTWH